MPLDADQWLYFFTLAVLLILFAGASNLVKSRTGRAIMAIRDHPIAAATMGINTALYKTLTFGVSAFYTGVAGALGAIAIQFVAPDSFTFLLSVSLLVGLVVGGVGSIPGSLFGGVFVLFVPNIAERVSTGLAGAIYGVILLLVIYVMPSGADRSLPRFPVPSPSRPHSRQSRRRAPKSNTAPGSPTPRSKSATPALIADRRRPTARSVRQRRPISGC